ncbi:hypothetical protein Ccrd_021346, partial [Cynara cardunculus var. scolymus]
MFREGVASTEADSAPTLSSYASEPHHAYLSISTPLLSTGSSISTGLPHYTIETVKRISQEVVEIVEPARLGYQLTLKLNFAKIPRKKDAVKIITEISSVQAVILSSQLREILRNFSQFALKRIQRWLSQRPSFRSLWMLEAQERVLGHLLATGRLFHLPKISPRHVEGKKLDKTVWNLLNFNALVKYHVKVTSELTRNRDQIYQFENLNNHFDSLTVHQRLCATKDEKPFGKLGRRGVKKLLKFTRCTILLRRWNLAKKMKMIRSRIRIHGFGKFQKRWLTLPSFASVKSYQKLDKSCSFRSS